MTSLFLSSARRRRFDRRLLRRIDDAKQIVWQLVTGESGPGAIPRFCQKKTMEMTAVGPRRCAGLGTELHLIHCPDRTTLAKHQTEERDEVVDDCPVSAGRLRKRACAANRMAARRRAYADTAVARNTA
jgi:hypothetical protein